MHRKTRNGTNLRVLFVGPAWTGSNAASMANAFVEVGFEVRHIDSTRASRPPRYSADWVRLKLGRGLPAPGLLGEIEETVRAWRPDVLFCFKTINLDQRRLLDLDVPIKIHYSADDISNPDNTTDGYLSHESDWDHIITTKRHNVAELEARGVRSAIFVLSAYDPAWHHPVAVSNPDAYRVGFIGSRRPDREELIASLGKAYGSQMLVAGTMSTSPSVKASGASLAPSMYGEDFSRGIATTMSNLVLLNSENRDTHTCRTFEVPAAGGLFVGQRTDEHREILSDEVEALLFDSDEELLERLAWVDSHPAEASRMRQRGREAILKRGDTYADRVRELARAVEITPSNSYQA